MNKIYNTQKEIASKIVEFLNKAVDNIRKTQLNILPFIVIGMILSESTVASDIAKNLKDEFGRDFVGMFVNGTCGNINHYNNGIREPRSFRIRQKNHQP